MACPQTSALPDGGRVAPRAGSITMLRRGDVAQLVELGIHKPSVTGSSPVIATARTLIPKEG